MIVNLNAANDNASFKFKPKITGKTVDNGTKDVEIIVPLKCLSNFWRTTKIPLINCEINIILIWSNKCMLSSDTKVTTFTITDTKLYISVVTLSTQYNAKLLEQLKSSTSTKDLFRLLNWSNFSRSKYTFCFIIWKWER